MLLASFLFSLMGATAKHLSYRLSFIEIVFLRNVFNAFLLFFSLKKRPPNHTGGRPFLLIFRGVIGTITLFIIFHNVTIMDLAVSTTYYQTYPLFVAIFSFLLFKESLAIHQWGSILLGFIGVLFVFQPGTGSTNFGITNLLLGLLSGIGTALAYLSISQLNSYYESRMIVLSFSLSGTLLPLLLMSIGEFNNQTDTFLFPKFILPIGIDWFFIAALTVSSLFGQILLTKAYSNGKAGIISVFGYSNIIFSIFLDLLITHKIPNSFTLLGVFLIIFSGFWISKKRG